MTANDAWSELTDLWPRFAHQSQYQQALVDSQAMYTARWQWGQYLEPTCALPGLYRGHCGLCGQRADFRFTAGTGGPVNLREEMSCTGCGLNARVRTVLRLLVRHAPPGSAANIYLTEQTTQLYKFVRQRWPQVSGSEYFDQGLRERLTLHLRNLINAQEVLRHEDVTALSFKDQSTDVIVSCDVLEHVPDYRRALAEFARVLRPKGLLLLTVPFMDQSAETKVRARVRDDGTIEHLEEPEYHGDPVDPKGVLAFYNFGWDLLDEVRRAGFSKAEWLLPWAPAEGIFWGLWTLRAVR